MFGNIVRTAGVVAATMAFISCDTGAFLAPTEDGPNEINGVEVASITLDAASMIVEDDTVDLYASVLDRNGQPIDDPALQLEWASSHENVATIESTEGTDGELITRSPGTTTLTVSYDEVSTSTTIEVHKRPVDLVYVTGSAQRGEPGTELPDSLAVRIIDKRGDAVSDVQVSFVVVSGGGTVSPQAGTTDAEGRLSAAWTLGATGEQVVEARASAAQARVKQVKDSVVVFMAQFTDGAGEPQVASVTVSPASDTVDAGATTRLEATVRDGDGNELTDRAVAWSSSDPTVATVADGGVVEGLAKGEIGALAKVDGVSGAADIMVADPADGTLTITSSVDTLVGVGTRATFAAEARAADGSLIPDPDVQWSSSDPTILTVDSMGKVTAQALGVAAITASAACCSAGDFVEATVVEDAPVTISPSLLSLSDIGSTGSMAVEVVDSNGSPVEDPEVSWTSLDTGIATVDSDGMVTATALGSTMIVAATTCCGSDSAAARIGHLHPNEPAGMTVIGSADGSIAYNADGAFGIPAMGPWFSHGCGGEDHVTVVDDPDNPTGSGKAVRAWWERCASDGGGEAAIANLAIPDYKEVYIALRLYYAANWDITHKFWYLRPSGSSSNGATTVHGLPDESLKVSTSNIWKIWVKDIMAPRGEEIFLEFHWIGPSDPNTADGKIYAYVNGTLVDSTTTADFSSYAGNAGTFDNLHFYMHSNDAPEDSYMYIRDFYVSGK